MEIIRGNVFKIANGICARFRLKPHEIRSQDEPQNEIGTPALQPVIIQTNPETTNQVWVFVFVTTLPFLFNSHNKRSMGRGRLGAWQPKRVAEKWFSAVSLITPIFKRREIDLPPSILSLARDNREARRLRNFGSSRMKRRRRYYDGKRTFCRGRGCGNGARLSPISRALPYCAGLRMISHSILFSLREKRLRCLRKFN